MDVTDSPHWPKATDEELRARREAEVKRREAVLTNLDNRDARSHQRNPEEEVDGLLIHRQRIGRAD